LVRKPGVLDKAGYETLREQYQKMQKAERRQILFRNPAPAAPALAHS
jgi:hypothetical protein